MIGGFVGRLLQHSSSKDAVLTTSYADDYIVRGQGFHVKKRVAIGANATLYFEVAFNLAAPKVVFSLPIKMNIVRGYAFIDTFQADSSTGYVTSASPLNMNELSTNSSLVTFKTGTTAPAGTVSHLREYVVGTDSTNQSGGGGTGGADSPKILDISRPRYVKIVNQEDVATILDFESVWYELVF